MVFMNIFRFTLQQFRFKFFVVKNRLRSYVKTPSALSAQYFLFRAEWTCLSFLTRIGS